MWKDLRKLFLERNRIPSIYISETSSIRKDPNIIPESFKKEYTDAWMLLEDFSKIDNILIPEYVYAERVTEKSQSKFIDIVMGAFGSTNPEDPYPGIPKYYKIALEKSFDGYKASEYTVLNFLGKLKDVPISSATAIYKGDTAGIYNVGTVEEFRKKGFSSAVLKEMIKELRNLGINQIFLQTGKDSYVEKYYKKIGLNTIAIGECYSEVK